MRYSRILGTWEQKEEFDPKVQIREQLVCIPECTKKHHKAVESFVCVCVCVCVIVWSIQSLLVHLTNGWHVFWTFKRKETEHSWFTDTRGNRISKYNYLDKWPYGQKGYV
jgi:hypothetical protein